ncbi:dTDP-4-dehydrorhamnose 3,5-epimerase family protein [Desulfoferula mesophila]|uniref:dTDP-4-dehydrorhamnose 3,5-epimerase n=1 Tax=Desulfoferula mesophila TaxID=3058419 RepID=A0AAU9F4C2_9BACT|nr:spore coat protein [Desulfoferula mesophilus]
MDLLHGVKVKPLKVIPDGRGRLVEILRADDEMFQGFGQVYMTTTRPGIVKAWHLHRKQHDHVFCAAGMIRLGIYDDREDSPTKGQGNEFFIGVHNPLLVQISPGLYHGWKCISTEEALIINTVTHPYDYAEPDEYRRDAHDPHIPWDWSDRDG